MFNLSLLLTFILSFAGLPVMLILVLSCKIQQGLLGGMDYRKNYLKCIEGLPRVQGLLRSEKTSQNTVWAIILVFKRLLKTVRSDHLSIILVFVFISPKFQNERSFYLCDHFSYPIFFRRLRRRKKAGDHSTCVIILVNRYCNPNRPAAGADFFGVFKQITMRKCIFD